MSLKNDQTHQNDLHDGGSGGASFTKQSSAVLEASEAHWFIAFFLGMTLAATFVIFRPFDGQSLSLGERMLLSFDALGVGLAVFYMAGLTYGRWKEHVD